MLQHYDNICAGTVLYLLLALLAEKVLMVSEAALKRVFGSDMYVIELQACRLPVWVIHPVFQHIKQH